MRTNITGNLGILAVALVLVPRATRAEPVVIPAAPDLEAEWKLQFEDLRIQMASLDLQGKEIDHLKMTRARALKRAQSESFRDSATILPTDRDPLDILLRRTEAVLREVLRLAPKADLAGAGTELSKLREQAARTDPAAEARYDLFAKVCLLRRRITLANPLLDFRDIVFVTRGPATSHMVPQYMAQSNSAGGGSRWEIEPAAGFSHPGSFSVEARCKWARADRDGALSYDQLLGWLGDRVEYSLSGQVGLGAGLTLLGTVRATGLEWGGLSHYFKMEMRALF